MTTHLVRREAMALCFLSKADSTSELLLATCVCCHSGCYWTCPLLMYQSKALAREFIGWYCVHVSYLWLAHDRMLPNNSNRDLDASPARAKHPLFFLLLLTAHDVCLANTRVCLSLDLHHSLQSYIVQKQTESAILEGKEMMGCPSGRLCTRPHGVVGFAVIT